MTAGCPGPGAVVGPCGRWGRLRRLGIAAVLVLAFPAAAPAQDLEPRALVNVPVGTSFAVVGYSGSTGSVLLDPTLPIEGLTSHLHSGIVGYARALNLFGLSGKVDALAAVATGRWTGAVNNLDTSRVATGLGDPRVRLSVNFLGSPALTRAAFRTYRPGTVAGASLQVWVPLGQYDPDRLLNLGSHRWTFAPQIGIAHTMGPWTVEGHVAAWLFTRNGDFYGGNALEQRPFLSTKVHLIRSLPRSFWVSLDAGIGAGARTVVNGTPGDSYQSAFRIGLTGAGRIANGHSLKLNLVTTQRMGTGPDYDSLTLAYQFAWGGT